MSSSPELTRSIRPIFIIGAPRSGTSIMNWVLGQHPNIQPMPETAWIASMAVSGYLSHLKGSERGRFSHLSNVHYPLAPFMQRTGEAIDAIVNDCFAERCRMFYGDAGCSNALSAQDPGAATSFQIKRAIGDPKRRWLDGTPLNSQYLWALSEMFPEALFIHNLRRPHEVAVSLEGFAKVGADPQQLEVGLETWISHTENAWLAERALGAGKVFRLPFERISADPEALLRELCAFLGEDYCADCLLPLGQRVNSSEVDDRREESLMRLQAMPAYQTALALFDGVLARPPSAHREAEAAAILHQRFLDYCHARSMV